MSRRHAAERREILPDAKYGNFVIAKFINCIMEMGKKSIAEKIVYGALNGAAARLKVDALEIFKTVVKNVRPHIEVRSRRVGGATYQVPVEVRDVRSIALALRWLKIAACKRAEKTMIAKLLGEMVDAFNNRGASVKKREDTHKMAEANKAFAHYRW